MARPVIKDYYHHKGLKTRVSDKREETESGKLASYIINKIPKNFNEFYYDNYDINEASLAHAIVTACGRYIRFCPQIGWLVYREDEGRWTEHYAESVVQRVITHFGHLLFENSYDSNAGEITFARHILSSAGISSIKNILKHDTTITVEQEMFDADPDLLNCKGDMYNLRTGYTRKVEPEDMFAKSTMCKASGLEWKNGRWTLPEIPKKFEDFMIKITSKEGVRRSDLSFYILSYFGYSLTGDNGASFFVNFHGQGKNGKSVLLNLMMELFGDYAAPISKDIIIENRFQSQFDLAGLPGIRLGVLIDAPEGRLNMDMLNSITAGDAINAKRKYLKDFLFKPVCKIAIGSNPKLTLKNTGMATRRRIRMIPFDYTVPDNELVVNLHRQLLKEEAPQILSLLIWFAHEYYRNGEGPKAFPPCEVIDETSAEYIESEDLVGRWVKERTEKAEGNIENATSLYEDFYKWATEKEKIRKVMGQNKFGEYLIFHVKKKKIEGKWFYTDIKIKTSTTSPPKDRSG